MVRVGVFLCIMVHGSLCMTSEAARFTVTIEPQIYEALLDVTDRRHPRLTKRYVVELALTRLFEDVRHGQLELGLEAYRGRH